ncbi:MAG: CHAT domain-containing protein [Cyanobacteria bacterium P01_G01_bin.54]
MAEQRPKVSMTFHGPVTGVAGTVEGDMVINVPPQPAPAASAAAQVSAPRKILFLAANPQETLPLRLDEEVRAIQQALERAKHRDRFQLIQKWAVTDNDLRRALLDHEPEVVHFSGHGEGDFGLLFAGKDGNAHRIAGEALSRLFALFAGNVKCVLLNACFSLVQAQAIATQIDYVMGMDQEIGDLAAQKFSLGFYDALGAGRDFTSAFQFGCNAIDLQSLPGYLTPQLLGKAVAM